MVTVARLRDTETRTPGDDNRHREFARFGYDPRTFQPRSVLALMGVASALQIAEYFRLSQFVAVGGNCDDVPGAGPWGRGFEGW